jgi:hypothetical protein
MVTLCIRYTLDPLKRPEFERYAQTLLRVIPRCGGEMVGYYMPTKLAGPTNFGLALINFPNLGAYEKYRENLLNDREGGDALKRAEDSRCVLLEDRTFLEQVRSS